MRKIGTLGEKGKILLRLISVMLLALPPLSCASSTTVSSNVQAESTQPIVITLPAPKLKGETSLEQTLQERRSVRDYSVDPLTIFEVSQILWAAQGKTAEWGGRSAPSAGALYPLEVYLIAGNVQELSPGGYRYSSERYELTKIKDGDLRGELAASGLEQASIKDGAIDLVISAVYERTTAKYGERGIRYAQMEAGHAAQNVCLQVTALGLGAVTVGAFDDNRVKLAVGLMEKESPLYIIPVGRKAN